VIFDLHEKALPQSGEPQKKKRAQKRATIKSIFPCLLLKNELGFVIEDVAL